MQKISTLVKTLNGDLFTVDHYNSQYVPPEYNLKMAINHAHPEFYSECQVLTYPDPEDKRFVYVFVDDVNTAIGIELEEEYKLFVCTHPEFLENYNNYATDDDIISFINSSNLKTYTTRCVSFKLYWNSIHNPDSKYSFMQSIIFHPKKGFLSLDMMRYDMHKYVDRENEENEFERWVFPKKEKIWFPTFRDLLLDNSIPKSYIFESEVFLDKVETAFLELKNK